MNKRTSIYSEDGAKKVEYFAIIKLIEDGLNVYQIHKKLGINRYSVNRVFKKCNESKMQRVEWIWNRIFQKIFLGFDKVFFF